MESFLCLQMLKTMLNLSRTIRYISGYARNNNSLYEASVTTKFQRRAMDEGRKIYPFLLKKLAKDIYRII